MTQIITVHGGLVATPEMRFTQSGTPFASFTVASSDRVPNRETGKWEDGKDRLFLRCTAWGNLAENIAASNLDKGAQIAVTGKLLTREWEHEGQKRSQVELKVNDFMASLKHATAQVTRASQQGQGGGFGGGSGQGQGEWAQPPANAPQNADFGGGFADEESQPF